MGPAASIDVDGGLNDDVRLTSGCYLWRAGRERLSVHGLSFTRLDDAVATPAFFINALDRAADR